MNKLQKAQVRKILASDCKLAGEYYSRGQTCAIGALALAAGVKKKLLKEQNDAGIDCKIMKPVASRIRKKFGMSIDEMAEIQEANDNIMDDVKERRREVLAVLDLF